MLRRFPNDAALPNGWLAQVRLPACAVFCDTNRHRSGAQVTVTISGYRFGSSGAQVMINQWPCANLVHKATNATQVVFCKLPAAAGAGSSIAVTLTQGQLVSAPVSLLSYNAPTVVQVSGCSDVGEFEAARVRVTRARRQRDDRLQPAGIHVADAVRHRLRSDDAAGAGRLDQVRGRATAVVAVDGVQTDVHAAAWRGRCATCPRDPGQRSDFADLRGDGELHCTHIFKL